MSVSQMTTDMIRLSWLHNSALLSSCVTHYQIFNKSNTNVSLVEQDLLTLPVHLCSVPILSVLLSLLLSVYCLVHHCLSFFPFSLCHCIVCPFIGHCIVCPSIGHCIVCPSIGHCIVCPSIGHCIVCPSIGHCIVCPSIGHCIVCPSMGHCIVCPSIGHCIVCPSSIGHCIVCPSSIGHCIVCPSSTFFYWSLHYLSFYWSLYCLFFY